jgi:PKHD-type hydroxylase
MIICIADVLSAEDLKDIHGLVERGRFVDGRETAGWHARLVKRNEQIRTNSDAARKAGERVAAALDRHEVFRAAALPRMMRPMLLSRYHDGMSYGAHVDDAIMGGKAPIRSDLSVTVFLNDPAAYDGGELVMETTGGEQAYKLAAGSAIIYPSTTLHRVEPVTRGTRLVAVTWVQSLVREAENREILFDLDTVRRTIFQGQGKSREFDLLSKTYANLLRKWSDL